MPLRGLPRRVRWSAFDPKLKDYQGALENKDLFVKYFLGTDPLPPSYDLSGLRLVWQEIIKQCIEIAEKMRIK